jgi:hypothetical protein
MLFIHSDIQTRLNDPQKTPLRCLALRIDTLNLTPEIPRETPLYSYHPPKPKRDTQNTPWNHLYDVQLYVVTFQITFKRAVLRTLSRKKT